MDSIPFKTIAAACRQAYNGVVRPTVVLEGLFNHSPQSVEEIIRFCYEDARVEQCLSDEDLREVFLYLTDAYPEEVDDNPDLVQIITQLSQQEETTVSLSFVLKQMKQIFNADNNKTRSVIINLLLRKINQRDSYWLFIRLLRRRNPFKRSHILNAMANHHDIFYDRLRRAANFLPLWVVAERLAAGEEMVGVPTIGSPLILPLPALIAKDDATFGCYVEVIRGERLSVHKGGNDLLLVYDTNGIVVEEVEGLETIQYGLDDGIYVVERTPQDDFPLKVVDTLLHEGTFEERRQWLEDHLPTKDFLKEMTWCDNPAQIQANTPKGGITFLHRKSARLTYNNTRDEVVRFVSKSEGQILRLIGGIYIDDPVRGLVMARWRVAARDGLDSYYEVGDVEAIDREMEKRLKRLTEPSKAMAGELAQMTGPTFVDVELHHADYDYRGIRISGVVKGILGDVGFSDVVAVEDLEWIGGQNHGG